MYNHNTYYYQIIDSNLLTLHVTPGTLNALSSDSPFTLLIYLFTISLGFVKNKPNGCPA